MDTLPTPETLVITDLEFIFLGAAKALVHTITETDFFEDRGDHYYIRWNDVGEDALLFKANLLQFGRRVRLVNKGSKNAVQQVLEEIKAQEAKAQGSTGKSAPVQGVAAVPLPGVGASVPADLWDRSPLKR